MRCACAVRSLQANGSVYILQDIRMHGEVLDNINIKMYRTRTTSVSVSMHAWYGGAGDGPLKKHMHVYQYCFEPNPSCCNI